MDKSERIHSRVGEGEFIGECSRKCGEGSPEGTHFPHPEVNCSWHDGPCEEPIWCDCPGDDKENNSG